MKNTDTPLMDMLDEIRDCTSCAANLSYIPTGATFETVAHMLINAVTLHRRFHASSYSIDGKETKND